VNEVLLHLIALMDKAIDHAVPILGATGSCLATVAAIVAAIVSWLNRGGIAEVDKKVDGQMTAFIAAAKVSTDETAEAVKLGSDQKAATEKRDTDRTASDEKISTDRTSDDLKAENARLRQELAERPPAQPTYPR
jgi:uncharacterized damage-inducible protein DinB